MPMDLPMSPEQSGSQALAFAKGAEQPEPIAPQPEKKDLSSLMQEGSRAFFGGNHGFNEDQIISDRVKDASPYWANMKDANGKSVYEHYMDSNPNGNQPQGQEESGGGFGLPEWMRLPEFEKDNSESTYTTDTGSQLMKVGVNAAKTAWNLPASIVNSLLHPWDTFKGVESLAIGLGDMAFSPKSDQAEMARQFLSKQLYGIGVDNVGDVLSKVIDQAKNDPAQLALNISGLLKAVSVAGNMAKAGKLGGLSKAAATSELGEAALGVAKKGAAPFEFLTEKAINPASYTSAAARIAGISKEDIGAIRGVDFTGDRAKAFSSGLSEGTDIKAGGVGRITGQESEFLKGVSQDIGEFTKGIGKDATDDMYSAVRNDTSPVGKGVVESLEAEFSKSLSEKFGISTKTENAVTGREFSTSSNLPIEADMKAARMAYDRIDKLKTLSQEGKLTVSDIANTRQDINNILKVGETPHPMAGAFKEALDTAIGKEPRLEEISNAVKSYKAARNVFGKMDPAEASGKVIQEFLKGGVAQKTMVENFRKIADITKQTKGTDELIQKLSDYSLGVRSSKMGEAGLASLGGGIAHIAVGNPGVIATALAFALRSPKLMARLVQASAIPERVLSKVATKLSAVFDKYFGGNKAANSGAEPMNQEVAAGEAPAAPVSLEAPMAAPEPMNQEVAAGEAPAAPVSPEAPMAAPEVVPDAMAARRHTLPEEAPVKKRSKAEMDKVEAGTREKLAKAAENNDRTAKKKELYEKRIDLGLKKVNKDLQDMDAPTKTAEAPAPKKAPKAVEKAPEEPVATVEKTPAAKRAAMKKAVAPADKLERLSDLSVAEVNKKISKWDVEQLISEVERGSKLSPKQMYMHKATLKILKDHLKKRAQSSGISS